MVTIGDTATIGVMVRIGGMDLIGVTDPIGGMVHIGVMADTETKAVAGLLPMSRPRDVRLRR